MSGGGEKKITVGKKCFQHKQFFSGLVTLDTIYIHRYIRYIIRRAFFPVIKLSGTGMFVGILRVTLGPKTICHKHWTLSAPGVRRAAPRRAVQRPRRRAARYRTLTRTADTTATRVHMCTTLYCLCVYVHQLVLFIAPP